MTYLERLRLHLEEANLESETAQRKAKALHAIIESIEEPEVEEILVEVLQEHASDVLVTAAENISGVTTAMETFVADRLIPEFAGDADELDQTGDDPFDEDDEDEK